MRSLDKRTVTRDELIVRVEELERLAGISRPEAPAAQAGLPAVGETVLVFGEKQKEDCDWLKAAVVSHDCPVSAVDGPGFVARILEGSHAGCEWHKLLKYEGDTWRRLQASEPHGLMRALEQAAAGTLPPEQERRLDEIAADLQSPEPAAEVAVTTEESTKSLRTFSRAMLKDAQTQSATSRGDEYLDWAATWWTTKAHEVLLSALRANVARVQAEHAREREADRRRIEELEKALKVAARQINSLERDRDNLRAQHTRNQEKSAELESQRDGARDNADLHFKLYEKEKSKADAYQKDWYAAKSEFGTAMGKLRQERDSARAKLARRTALLRDYVFTVHPEAELRKRIDAELATDQPAEAPTEKRTHCPCGTPLHHLADVECARCGGNLCKSCCALARQAEKSDQPAEAQETKTP